VYTLNYLLEATVVEKDKGPEDMEEMLKCSEIYKKLMKAREAVDFLCSLSLALKRREKDLHAEIDRLEKENRVFITKPFLYGTSAGRSTYFLMQSRAHALMQIIERNRLEAERENR
jgi:hypothetical protein